MFSWLFGKKEGSQKRSPRVRLTGLDNIVYQMQSPVESPPIRVTNISSTGVGLRRNSMPTWPRKGTVLHGHMLLEDREYPLSLRIKRIGKEVVGCKYEGYSQQIQAMINSFFDQELAALKMIEVNPDSLDPVAGGKPSCYFGGSGSELYLIENEKGDVSFFQMSFCGYYLEGGLNTTLRLGTILLDNRDGALAESSLVQWQNPVPQEQIDLAVRFVSNIKPLREKYCRDILKFIQQEN